MNMRCIGEARGVNVQTIEEPAPRYLFLSVDSIIEAFYRIPPTVDRARLAWACCHDTLRDVLKMKDSNGMYLARHEPTTLLGLPVEVDQVVYPGVLEIRYRQAVKAPNFCSYCGSPARLDDAGACRGCGARC